MITISLCMIVKNEEAFLARCLNTLKDIMDEIIIVDTGSTDSTRQIAATFTDKIYHFIAPKILGDNTGLSCFNFQKSYSIDDAKLFKFENIKEFSPDILLTYSSI